MLFRSPREKEKGTKTKKPHIVVPDPKRKIFTVNKLQTGFSVTLVEGQLSFPIKATIRVAYDTMRGNPFNKYSTFDFDFTNDALSVTVSEGDIVKAANNKLHIIMNKGFELKVKGFDENRDIIVDVREVK